MTTGLFIFEGPDAAGKTTLAKELMKLGKDPLYLHLKLHKNLPYRQLMALHIAQREYKRRMVIIDRHWLSEQVYGTVYRGEVATDNIAWDLLEWSIAMNTVNILCCPPPDESVEQFTQAREVRKEHYQLDGRILKCARLYHMATHGKADGCIWEEFKPGCLAQAIVNNGGMLTLHEAFNGLVRALGYNRAGHNPREFAEWIAEYTDYTPAPAGSRKRVLTLELKRCLGRD